jgi:hypothetical protein
MLGHDFRAMMGKVMPGPGDYNAGAAPLLKKPAPR